jgi:hypothetical protein
MKIFSGGVPRSIRMSSYVKWNELRLIDEKRECEESPLISVRNVHSTKTRATATTTIRRRKGQFFLLGYASMNRCMTRSKNKDAHLRRTKKKKKSKRNSLPPSMCVLIVVE